MNSDLKKKESDALRFIRRIAAHYKRPCILFSGGKDSSVLLHLASEAALQFGVVSFMHPWLPQKNVATMEIAAHYGGDLYADVPPDGFEVVVSEDGAHAEIAAHYRVGAQTLRLPIGREEDDGEGNLLCGRDDIVGRPRGRYDWPWDVAFSGHRSVDSDPLLGALPLRVDVQHALGACHLAFPLRTWTDADLWDYITSEKVKINEARYDVAKRCEIPDRSQNPDYYKYCMKCLDPRSPAVVTCPKLAAEVPNISHQLKIARGHGHSYIGSQVDDWKPTTYNIIE
jgi:sulfate adenylyltransferase subunit 2